MSVDHRPAIRVRFVAPTNFNGARWSASSDDGRRVLIHQDYALNPRQNEEIAAQAWLDKFLDDDLGKRELLPIALSFKGETFFSWRFVGEVSDLPF